MSNMVNIIGYSASILSTIAFLPQAYKVVRTKEVEGISLLTYTIFVASVILWFVYGVFINDIPIIASNIVCIVLGSVILWYKLVSVLSKHKKEDFK